MQTKFHLVFSRADGSALSEMFGSERISLIQSVNARNFNVIDNRQILLDTFTPASILSDRKQRSVMLSLLREVEARELILQLNEPVNNEYYDVLQRLPLNIEKLKKVFEFFNIEYPEKEEVINEPQLEEVNATYGLFDHQRRAVIDVLTQIKRAPYRVVLHMPTGSGKTRTAMNVIAQFLRESENATVLWLANSEELCGQAFSEFKACWQKIGNRNLTAQRFWGSHNNLQKADGLIVASFNKIYKRSISSPSEFATFSENIKLVIVDEAHQIIAPTYQHVVDAIVARNNDAAILGLTATPGRTWNDPEKDRQVVEFFARRKVNLKIDGYDNPVEYLIDRGYLARPIFETIQLNCLDENEISRINEAFEIPENLMKKLADDQMRTLKIIEKTEQLIQRHKRILLFATTVEHAETLSIILKMKGHASKCVSSKNSEQERRSIINWYKQDNPESRVLCNFGILTTGFDAPKTSAAVIARPTKSLVLFSQMVGRATRGIRANGNQEAEIVTVLDTNLPGFGNMNESFNNWEDIWND